MTDVYAPESAGPTAPTVLDRAQSLRRYLSRRDAEGVVQLVRSEAEDDPAALLVALLLTVPAYLSRPPSLGLVLVALAVRRARA